MEKLDFHLKKLILNQKKSNFEPKTFNKKKKKKKKKQCAISKLVILFLDDLPLILPKVC